MNRESGMGNRDFGSGDGDVVWGFSENEQAKTIVDHRDLDVWRTAMALAKQAYLLTSSFPSDERFGLISQIRRAAVSIPANIAEGYGRGTSGAYIQFLHISQGSARELETLIELSNDLGYLKAADFNTLNEPLSRVIMMLGRLIRAIERRKAP